MPGLNLTEGREQEEDASRWCSSYRHSHDWAQRWMQVPMLRCNRTPEVLGSECLVSQAGFALELEAPRVQRALLPDKYPDVAEQHMFRTEKTAGDGSAGVPVVGAVLLRVVADDCMTGEIVDVSNSVGAHNAGVLWPSPVGSYPETWSLDVLQAFVHRAAHRLYSRSEKARGKRNTNVRGSGWG